MSNFWGAVHFAFVRKQIAIAQRRVKGLTTMIENLSAERNEIEAWANNGVALMKCAVMLFLGYADQATQIAESNGGGGGSSSDLEWGRKPDEDDRKWALRCILEAQRLMRPSQKSRSFRR